MGAHTPWLGRTASRRVASGMTASPRLLHLVRPEFWERGCYSRTRGAKHAGLPLYTRAAQAAGYEGASFQFLNPGAKYTRGLCACTFAPETTQSQAPTTSGTNWAQHEPTCLPTFLSLLSSLPCRHCLQGMGASLPNGGKQPAMISGLKHQ